MKYRKEIDGLRAFAVLPVILFHAGFTTFSGGFVGVDIFFVISGYLITTIIVDEMDEGSFSLLNFYERRARRILPALFFVMLCTLPFAWFWMLPHDLKLFSESLVATSLFASNVHFYLTSGYFDSASELKPLLHTWSLAVEEQYYFLFPPFLMLAWKLGKKWIFSLLLLIAIISVLAAQWGSITHPSFTFFLLPTRGFEILIGALISLYINHKAGSISVSQSVSQSVSLAGLILILYSIFAFDRKTPSPSFYTLIPTMGTSAILIFANSKNLVGKLLGSKLLIGIGLISYSAYLWHQPLLAFSKLKNYEDPTNSQLLMLCLSSLLLGYLSWRYIENPFRNKNLFSCRKFIALSLTFATIFLVIGLYGYKNEGLISRYPPEAHLYIQNYDAGNWYIPLRKDNCHLLDFNLTRHANICHETKRPLVALWGDSHAASLYPGLKKIQNEHNFGLTQLTQAGCPPLVDIEKQTRLNCDFINSQNLKELKNDNPDVLILHSAWGIPVYTYSNNDLKIKLNTLINNIKNELPHTKIIIVGPVPRWKISPQNSSYVFWLNKKGTIVPSRLNGIVLTDIESLLKELSISNSIQFISLNNAMCDEGVCVSRLGNTIDDFIQVDYGHLSKVGSEFLVEKIKSEIVINLPKR